jgi:Co/Zn/Cd efflux system component
MKEVAFAVSTGLTAVYCVVELALAISLGSLALMADAFHNVSDVVSVRACRGKRRFLFALF